MIWCVEDIQKTCFPLRAYLTLPSYSSSAGLLKEPETYDGNTLAQGMQDTATDLLYPTR